MTAPETPAPEALTRFVHRFVPAREGVEGAGIVLLLLHGTGGDENDLLQLGEMISHGAAILSPRGRVLDTYAYEGAGRQLKRMGVILGGLVPSHKARIKLMLLLGAGYGVDQIRASFED